MAKPGADLAPTSQTGTNRQTRRGAVSPHSPDPVEPRPVELVPLDALQPDERNANKGTERGAYMIRQSLRKLGAGRSILLDKNGKVIAGNKTLESAADIGLDDVLVVRTRGDKLVAVLREDLDLDDPEGQARQLAYADNRTGQVSLDWEPHTILADLDAGVDLSDWFTAFELDAFGAAAYDSGTEKGAKPNPRVLPLDVIYTLQMADCTCCLAVQAGLKYGINSAHYRLCPYTYELTGRHEVAFIDNEYRDYNHAVHLTAVQKFKPKYTTVRDVMTEAQCAADGIRYYPLEQILEWAEELSEHAENVIVIPKYDCIAAIPEKFMLGYSVPSSHGGTPLSVDVFRGRRVHLLGGSWKKQLEYLAALGEDVVSLDNNNVELVASKWGQYCDPQGHVAAIHESLPHVPRLNNVRYAALALSFGFIGAAVNELCGIPTEVLNG